MLKVLEAEPATWKTKGAPGTVLRGLEVACGEGALRLLRVQRPGRAAMAADAFLRGAPVPRRHGAGRGVNGHVPFALLIEYDGAPFAGWQIQDGVPTVQQVLEDAAARLTGGPVASVVAGRTDAGVHASGQVAMLSLPARGSRPTGCATR